MSNHVGDVPDPKSGMALTAEGYRTSPDQETTGWPPGVKYIVGNEGCERFSYYGMKAILYVHLVSLYMISDAVRQQIEGSATWTTWFYQLRNYSASAATMVTHLFLAGVYALPMVGAIVADRYAGKYKTIFYLSLVYCAGHGVLAIGDDSLMGMYIGLALIAIGSGGIKPCVSANVGDQFGKGNWFRVRTIFQIFYFSINFGSFFSTILIPIILANYGASVAFGIPGILMFIATIIFWMGRKKFVHVPPSPGGKLGLLDTFSSVFMFMSLGHLFFTARLNLHILVLLGISVAFLGIGITIFYKRQKIQPDDGFLAITLYAIARWFRGGGSTSSESNSSLAKSRFWGPAVQRYGEEATEGPVAVFKIVSVTFFVFVFWALFDQHSSTWIRQAESMDRRVFGFELLANQLAALNPLMVMILIPFMNPVYNWFDKRGLKTTPLRRMTVGMGLASFSFVAVALIQMWIDSAGEGQVHVFWQIIPYLIITISEVLVSITGLEFAYTQAPKRMKSTVMGFWLLMVSLGNILVASVSAFEAIPLAQFFWIFAGVMAVAGLLFGLRAYFYVPKDFTQD